MYNVQVHTAHIHDTIDIGIWYGIYLYIMHIATMSIVHEFVYT